MMFGRRSPGSRQVRGRGECWAGSSPTRWVAIHPHTLTPSHPHTLTPSHPHSLTPSHPNTLTPSHPHHSHTRNPESGLGKTVQMIATVLANPPNASKVATGFGGAGTTLVVCPATVRATLCTIHHTPYTMHSTSYTIHHAPYFIPYTIHHAPYSIQPSSLSSLLCSTQVVGGRCA